MGFEWITMANHTSQYLTLCAASLMMHCFLHFLHLQTSLKIGEHQAHNLRGFLTLANLDLLSHYLSHTSHTTPFDALDVYALSIGMPNSKPVMSCLIALAAACKSHDTVKQGCAPGLVFRTEENVNFFAEKRLSLPDLCFVMDTTLEIIPTRKMS